LLCENEIIDSKLSERLKAMVGFRNIAVHDYQNINLNILKQIIEKHLNDLKRFSALMLKS
jgi:uncharacterized protein YutE (UPF0331/DUF86 family)